MFIFQTGQRRCYDEEGRVVPCMGLGQDGEIQTGIPLPERRFRPVGEGIVKDMLTGLEWAQDAAINVFPQSWEDALLFVKSLNERGFQGFNDWRMPNRRELRSLLYLEAKNPCLYPGHSFINVFHGWYWTSTTAAINTRYAWYIHLGGARMFYGRKDQECMLWPVRGESDLVLATGQKGCWNISGQEIPCENTGQDGEYQAGVKWPNPRFLHKGEVVEDRLTGLFWTRNADISGGMVSWPEAFKIVRELNSKELGGFSDWRLPNINELESLVDCSKHSPAVPEDSCFKNVREFYWSSTTSIYDPPWAWALYMFKGATGVGLKRLRNFYVWAVRG